MFNSSQERDPNNEGLGEREENQDEEGYRTKRPTVAVGSNSGQAWTETTIFKFP
jgi:hypothetical protein